MEPKDELKYKINEIILADEAAEIADSNSSWILSYFPTKSAKKVIHQLEG